MTAVNIYASVYLNEEKNPVCEVCGKFGDWV